MTLVERNLSSTSYGNTDKASITQSIHHTSTPQKYSPGAYQAYSLNPRSFLTPFPGHFQSCIRAIPSLVLRNFPALYLDIVPLNSGQFPASYSGNSLHSTSQLHTWTIPSLLPSCVLRYFQPCTQAILGLLFWHFPASTLYSAIPSFLLRKFLASFPGQPHPCPKALQLPAFNS